MKLIANIEALLAPLSGVGVYSRELLIRLSAAPAVEEIVFFAGHRRLDPRDANAILQGSSENDAGDGGKPQGRRITRLLRRHLPELLWLASHFMFWWRTRKLGDHVYVELNNVARPFVGRTLLVCHDLSHIHYPQYHPAERRRYFRLFFWRSLNGADVVATVSHAVAREISQRFNRNCVVIPPAVDTTAIDRDGDRLKRLADQYDLPDRFLLTVASLEPRKNLEGLIDAWLGLDAGLRAQIPLIMVGGEGWENAALKQRLQELEKTGQVRHLGYVPGSALDGIYQLATAFALLSHYEGFGIPVVEAMACGIPVLISTDPALVETAGGAARVVDASDLQAATAALTELLGDEALRARLVNAGRENVARFSWDKSARLLLDACLLPVN